MSRGIWTCRTLFLTVVLAGFAVLVMSGTVLASAIQRVSLNSSGVQANDASGPATGISADGRYVVFDSMATNLVTGSLPGFQEVFVRDRVLGTTTLASVDSDLDQANGPSYGGEISADGRYVTFVTNAMNMPLSDEGMHMDVFRYDRTNPTEPVMLVSEDSRYPLELEGPGGNDDSSSPSISADGNYVAFLSYATNLVSGNYTYTPGVLNVFVTDCTSGETTLVSVNGQGEALDQNSQGTASVSISADGNYVAFSSDATNMGGGTSGVAQVYVRDLNAGTTTLVSMDSNGVPGDQQSCMPHMSADGRYVTFRTQAALVSGATPGMRNVYVHDLQTGSTTTVNLNTSGLPGNGASAYPSISADGRHVAFLSDSSDLATGGTAGAVNLFVRDLVSGTTTLVAANNRYAPSLPLINGDGSCVAFSADDNVNVGPNGVWDVFLASLESAKPPTMLHGLSDFITAPTVGTISPQAAPGLTAGVNAALAALAKGNRNAGTMASNNLNALIHYVNAQTGTKISPDAAASLIWQANAIVAAIGS